MKCYYDSLLGGSLSLFSCPCQIYILGYQSLRRGFLDKFQFYSMFYKCFGQMFSLSRILLPRTVMIRCSREMWPVFEVYFLKLCPTQHLRLSGLFAKISSISMFPKNALFTELLQISSIKVLKQKLWLSCLNKKIDLLGNEFSGLRYITTKKKWLILYKLYFSKIRCFKGYRIGMFSWYK